MSNRSWTIERRAALAGLPHGRERSFGATVGAATQRKSPGRNSMDQPQTSQSKAAGYDRSTEDVGNIVEFGHVNVQVPDQRLATLFYVSGLGLTRDPFLNGGVDNMWVNVGASQFHLPSGPAQVLRGVTGLVLPDLDALLTRLARVREPLAETRFGFSQRADGAIDVTCPWGNRIRCHAPDPRLGRITLGIPYVEMDAPPGTAGRIARFYREVMRAPASVAGEAAVVRIGTDFRLVLQETDRVQPEWDGNHIQVSLADFSSPHAWLAARGLVTEESNQHQYRFCDVVDVDSNALLLTVEHEVRSMRHPTYARALVNRAPRQTVSHYAAGHEIWPASMPAE